MVQTIQQKKAYQKAYKAKNHIHQNAPVYCITCKSHVSKKSYHRHIHSSSHIRRVEYVLANKRAHEQLMKLSYNEFDSDEIMEGYNEQECNSDTVMTSWNDFFAQKTIFNGFN
jgi:hypothetical protein